MEGAWRFTVERPPWRAQGPAMSWCCQSSRHCPFLEFLAFFRRWLGFSLLYTPLLLPSTVGPALVSAHARAWVRAWVRARVRARVRPGARALYWKAPGKTAWKKNPRANLLKCKRASAQRPHQIKPVGRAFKLCGHEPQMVSIGHTLLSPGGRQTPLQGKPLDSLHWPNRIKGFAPTSKCKMCFEAHGSGELSYEMNYRGSKAGGERNHGGASANLESREATVQGSLGAKCCRAARQCYNHTAVPRELENSKTVHSSNELWELKIFLENLLSLVCMQVFPNSSGSN